MLSILILSLILSLFSICCILILPNEKISFKIISFLSSLVKHEHINYILFQCEKCFAGQLALWSYVIMSLLGYLEYNLILHVAFVFSTISITFILSLIIQVLENIKNK